MTPPPDFEALFEASPAASLLFHAAAPYTIVAVSDAYLKATMQTREGLIGRALFDVFPDDGAGDGATNLRRSIETAVRTGTASQLHAQRYTIQCPEGFFVLRYWDADDRPLQQNGAVAYVLHTVVDVTERELTKRREAEQAARASAAEAGQHRAEETIADLQRIIDKAQAGIFIFTPVRNDAGAIEDFQFRIVNQALAAYVGQSAAAVAGTLGSLYFPDYKNNGLFDKYRETAETGVTNRFEFHYDGGGIDVWLDIMSTRIGDEVLVTFTDHTALRRMQDRSEKMVADLKRSNASLEEFAYVASHDLQEPLRKIQSFGNMLQSRYGESLGAGGALVERMQGAAERMRTLIEDLLTYSRLSVRPDRLRPVETDAVLQEVLNDLEASVKERGAVLHWQGLEAVQGDPLQLRQLFQNLLGNALKFSKPDVPPRIDIEGRRESGADAGFEPGSPESRALYLRLDVCDNGIGFEPEYAGRIFQIFQRLHGRTEVPGTGVGLSIVQKVVENHNGRIRASSVPGQGATFTVWLPLAEAAA